MTELDTALEHLRMTVISAQAIQAEQAGVMVHELALLIDAYADALLSQIEAETSQLVCLGCILDKRNGTRTDDPNPAVVVASGNGVCLEHLRIVDEPILPGRTPGGIIFGNGI